MNSENVHLAVPTHDCGDNLMRRPVRIRKDGRGYDWPVNYCAGCETYVYGLPGERFETNSPEKMGEYITNQIKLGKPLHSSVF